MFRYLRHQLEQQQDNGKKDFLSKFIDRCDHDKLNHLQPQILRRKAYYHALIAIGDTDKLSQFMADRPEDILRCFREEDQNRVNPDSQGFQNLRQAFLQWQDWPKDLKQRTFYQVLGAALARPYFANGQDNHEQINALFQDLDSPEGLTAQEVADVAFWDFHHGYMAHSGSDECNKQTAELSLQQAAQFASHALDKDQQALDINTRKWLLFYLQIYVSDDRNEVTPDFFTQLDALNEEGFANQQAALLERAKYKLTSTYEYQDWQLLLDLQPRLSRLYQQCQQGARQYDLASFINWLISWFSSSRVQNGQQQINRALTEISDVIKRYASPVEEGSTQLMVNQLSQVRNIASDMCSVLNSYQALFNQHRGDNDLVDQIRHQSETLIASVNAGRSLFFRPHTESPHNSASQSNNLA